MFLLDFLDWMVNQMCRLAVVATDSESNSAHSSGKDKQQEAIARFLGCERHLKAELQRRKTTLPFPYQKMCKILLAGCGLTASGLPSPGGWNSGVESAESARFKSLFQFSTNESQGRLYQCMAYLRLKLNINWFSCSLFPGSHGYLL